MPLSEKQQRLFLGYMLELLEWNRTINLTRIVGPREIAIKHFLDSILIARHIAFAQKKVADVGSGSGFPGIPLAILEPDCTVVLIESQRKKTSFLKHIVRTLQLKNVLVHNGRAQDYPEPGTFDLVVCRAVDSLSAIRAIASGLIRTGGSIICMKGKLPRDEINALENEKKGAFSVETHHYGLPDQGGERSLVILRPCFT